MPNSNSMTNWSVTASVHVVVHIDANLVNCGISKSVVSPQVFSIGIIVENREILCML